VIASWFDLREHPGGHARGTDEAFAVVLKVGAGMVVTSAVLRELVEGLCAPVEAADSHAALERARRIMALSKAQGLRRRPAISRGYSALQGYFSRFNKNAVISQ
jgi:hypothetical protein